MKNKIKTIPKNLLFVLKKIWWLIKVIFRFFMKKRVYAITSIALSVLTVLFLICFIEFRSNNNDMEAVSSFVFNSPRLFVYSSLVLFALLGILVALIGNVHISLALMSAFLVLLMYSNSEKLIYRNAPVLPEDFSLLRQFGLIIESIETKGFIVAVAAAAIILVAVTVPIIILKCKRVMPKFSVKTRLLSRVSFGLAGLLFLIVGTLPVRTVTERHFIDFLDAQLIVWNQSINYVQNGFVVGFISNIAGKGAAKPDNYSKTTMESIFNKYIEIAQRENTLRSKLRDDSINFIFVVNESFFDPIGVQDLFPFSGGDPLHYFRSYCEKFPNGKLFVDEFGGGTANVEFEALTGFTTYFSPSYMPFAHLIPSLSEIPSLFNLLKSESYFNTAIHPHWAANYRRDVVYPKLGFDSFFDIQDFRKYVFKHHVPDKYVYEEVFKQLRATNLTQAIYALTIQNHTPFVAPMGVNRFVSTTNHSDNSQISNYLELIHISDKELNVMLQKLKDNRKKAIVVFYGDHLPGPYVSLEEHNRKLKHQTPLLIWSNFEFPNANALNLELGTFSPIYLNSIIFDLLNMEKPPFYYMLDALKEKAPILAHNYLEDKGSELYEHEIFIEYELICYDALFGNQYYKYFREFYS